MARRSTARRTKNSTSTVVANIVTHRDIDKAESVEDLKALLHKMVDTQNKTVSAVSRGVRLNPKKMKPEEVKQLLDRLQENRETNREAFGLTLPVHMADYKDGELDDATMLEIFKSDGLISPKYIKATRKEWVCIDCEETIEVGSEAFRSEFFTGREYLKHYRCTPCFKKRAADLEDEANDSSHTIALYASQGIQD